MCENFETSFDRDAVKTVKLTDWMEWASCKPGAPHNVVLPMIQRGSVWAPHKLLDLWDTLLRGMPLGTLMASEVVGETVQNLAVGGTSEAKLGAIGLIDGQQRTLSMLAGWPQGLQNPWRPVVIWVDLADKPQGEYQFRMWVTTKAQPFGYARASMGGQPLNKLERRKLHFANQAWEKMTVQELWSQPDFMPWEAKFALPLTELIDNQRNGTLPSFVQARLAIYVKALEEKVRKATDSQVADENASEEEHATKIELQRVLAGNFAKKLTTLPTEAELVGNIPALEAALKKVFACKFPLIHVRQDSFEDKTRDAEVDEVNTDPPLAILFKRVGTGGEPLSNADYVYSVIKHHAPTVHNMVDALLRDEKIHAVYTSTTLVMSAVRMTMLSLVSVDSQGKTLTDSAKLDKAAFARMVRNHPGFIIQFQKDIQPDGAFTTCLKQVLNSMSYSAEFNKTGLPKHALCLVPIPLLETILAWHTLHAPSADAEALKPSCLPMVRFALQGNLCVLDYAKASEVAIKALKEGKVKVSDIFPDQALMIELCVGEKATAYALPSPDKLKAILVMPMECATEVQKNPDAPNTTWRLPETPDNPNGLRGWTRFGVVNEADKQHAEIYKRWWNRKGGHVHPMLLWLQRDYVYAKFEKELALAGMDEETPYDFDHILPSAQWAYWTGSNNVAGNRFIDYPLKDTAGTIVDNTGHGHIGNSIGNIHVLDSSDNRSFGDTPVSGKLIDADFANYAQISDASKAVWLTASGDKNNARHWDKARALAFQTAVELRTFALYQKFYADLQCGS